MGTAALELRLAHPNVTRICKEVEVYESLLTLDGKTILELGCGKADHTRNIAQAHPSAHITAAEVDRTQLEKNLNSPGPENIKFTDFGAESIPLPDASIDIVMMFRSLHHVPMERMDDAFSEIRRVLKRGGYAYVSEPVFAGPYNEMSRIYNDEERVRSAAFGAICRCVEAGLLEPVSETFFGSPVYYRNFEEFAKKHFKASHDKRRVTEEQKAAVERLFNSHLGPDGVKLAQEVRVDLLRKPA